ncbi:hypothetical protein QTP88_011133 [Uroleucon formosanum]
MAQKRKLTTLSLAEKVNLLKIIEKGEKKKHDIAKDFGIPVSTSSTIIKNKDVILKNFNENSATRKKMKLGEYSDIESNDNNDEWDQLNLNETFTSYVNVDENLEICGEWTENDIISDILDEDNEEEIEDQQIQSTITNKEAKFALETLRKYIEGNEGMEDLFKPLGAMLTVLTISGDSKLVRFVRLSDNSENVLENIWYTERTRHRCSCPDFKCRRDGNFLRSVYMGRRTRNSRVVQKMCNARKPLKTRYRNIYHLISSVQEMHKAAHLRTFLYVANTVVGQANNHYSGAKRFDWSVSSSFVFLYWARGLLLTDILLTCTLINITYVLCTVRSHRVEGSIIKVATDGPVVLHH